MEFNDEGLEIKKEEVQYALKKRTSGKGTGPDGISVEIITALENVGIATITSLLNKIYSRQYSNGHDQISIPCPKRNQDQRNAGNIGR